MKINDGEYMLCLLWFGCGWLLLLCLVCIFIFICIMFCLKYGIC